MGLKLFRRKQHTEATRPANMGAVNERYNAYFPRLFAYVRPARRLCRPALKQARVDDGDSLNRREREALSLVFDAGLTREQIARLFRIRESTVSALLMTGLRKLKEQTSPAAAAAYLKLA